MSNSVWTHRWQPTRFPHPRDSPGKNDGVGRHFLLQSVKVKSFNCVWLFATPWTAAYQVPPSMGFSRQEYWSGLPLPSLLSIANEFPELFFIWKSIYFSFIFKISFIFLHFSRYRSLDCLFFFPTLILFLLVWLLMGSLLKHMSCPSLGYMLGFFQDFLCLLLSGNWVWHVQVYFFYIFILIFFWVFFYIDW